MTPGPALFSAEAPGRPTFLLLARNADAARDLVWWLIGAEKGDIAIRESTPHERASWDAWALGFGAGSTAAPAAVSLLEAERSLRGRVRVIEADQQG